MSAPVMPSDYVSRSSEWADTISPALTSITPQTEQPYQLFPTVTFPTTTGSQNQVIILLIIGGIGIWWFVKKWL